MAPANFVLQYKIVRPVLLEARLVTLVSLVIGYGNRT